MFAGIVCLRTKVTQKKTEQIKGVTSFLNDNVWISVSEVGQTTNFPISQMKKQDKDRL